MASSDEIISQLFTRLEEQLRNNQRKKALKTADEGASSIPLAACAKDREVKKGCWRSFTTQSERCGCAAVQACPVDLEQSF